MNTFKDIIFDSNTVIHCLTEEMAINLLLYARSKGYTWGDEDEYDINNTLHDEHRYNTCYHLSYGTVGSVSEYEKDYNIMEYNDVINK